MEAGINIQQENGKKIPINNCVLIVSRGQDFLGKTNGNGYTFISPEQPNADLWVDIATNLIFFGHRLIGEEVAHKIIPRLPKLCAELGIENPYEIENRQLKQTIESMKYAIDQLTKKEGHNE